MPSDFCFFIFLSRQPAYPPYFVFAVCHCRSARFPWVFTVATEAACRKEKKKRQQRKNRNITTCCSHAVVSWVSAGSPGMKMPIHPSPTLSQRNEVIPPPVAVAPPEKPMAPVVQVCYKHFVICYSHSEIWG